MIKFQILGRVPVIVKINDVESTVYEERWFDAQYDKKTGVANYLRSGGVVGAEMKLGKELKALLDK
tara:strand:- start:325 stop:522 length:198 start_codon:yes stop_codon:yes gene_type:complete